MIKSIFTIACILLSSIFSNAYAQLNAEACGKISAFNKYPLKGVEVEAKKSQSSTTTDAEGKYCLPVKKNDKITVKADGFETGYKKVSSTDEANINLIYKPNDQSYATVVSKGYMAEDDLKYAVNHLSSENNNFSEYTNIFTLITSRFPGVTVGTDNNGNGTVIVRNARSMMNDPGALYVVNGVVVPSIAQINPADVATIDIVKDSGASVYGIRGANGAVVITTKSK